MDETFAGKTAYITLKNHHTWSCPVCVSDAIFKGNISLITGGNPARSQVYIFFTHHFMQDQELWF